MQIVPMRRGSLGLDGTFMNAEHHARHLIPLIEVLSTQIERAILPKVWHQGHNVHVLETNDGRKFVLRPWSRKGVGYIGIRLLLRVSRGNEVHLSTLPHDAMKDDVLAFTNMLIFLMLDSPQHEEISSEEALQVHSKTNPDKEMRL